MYAGGEQKHVMSHAAGEPADGRIAWIADTECHTVDRKTLQQHIRTIVRRCMPLGAISLRALREELQLNLGMTLVSHKAEIRHLAEHALEELTLQQQLVATGICDGVWEPIPIRHLAELALREFTLEQKLVATGICDGAWEPIPLALGKHAGGRTLFHLLSGNQLCGGQDGVPIDDGNWELFCLEHSIQPDGQIPLDMRLGGGDDGRMGAGEHVPPSLVVASEPAVTDEVCSGPCAQHLSGVDAENYLVRGSGLGCPLLERLLLDYVAEITLSVLGSAFVAVMLCQRPFLKQWRPSNLRGHHPLAADRCVAGPAGMRFHSPMAASGGIRRERLYAGSMISNSLPKSFRHQPRI
ncbi:unnamed protein product [Symbiodinium sp. CCMP2592]|nr:unnamed protein product [Symbiodinium sp. CCMP2592]